MGVRYDNNTSYNMHKMKICGQIDVKHAAMLCKPFKTATESMKKKYSWPRSLG